MNRIDTEGLCMRFMFQNELLQVIEGLFVDGFLPNLNLKKKKL